MPIGHCLAKSYFDAADFVMMLDALFVVLGLWAFMTRDREDNGPELSTMTSAFIGLPAGFLAKYGTGVKWSVTTAMVLSSASCLAWVHSIIVSVQFMGKVREEFDEGLISVPSSYWPFHP